VAVMASANHRKGCSKTMIFSLILNQNPCFFIENPLKNEEIQGSGCPVLQGQSNGAAAPPRL